MRSIIPAVTLIALVTSVGFGGEPGTKKRGDDGAVRNWLTGKLADGSLRARNNPPGLVRMVNEHHVELLGVMRREGEGKFSGLDEPLTAFGRLFKDGAEIAGHMNEIEIGTIIDSGVLKNPGPTNVSVVMRTGTGIRIMDLRAGDAINIGDHGAEILATTHEVGCLCSCDTDEGLTSLPSITVNCCGVTTPPSQVSECNCACHNNQTCLHDDRRGKTKDCEAALVPSGD